jgi:hypothetical protein
MNNLILSQLTYFKRVSIPLYIESKIQLTALKHLDLPDMGKLRDRMEGQLYYNKLRTDIVAEYAFENIIGLRNFDWEKRDIKSYKRKKYIFENKELNIISFENGNLPKISTEHVQNCIFVYVNTGNRVLLSSLATKSYLQEIAKKKKSKIIEISDFQDLIDFSSVDELITKME